MFGIIGTINAPPGVINYIGTGQAGAAAAGFVPFMNNLVKLLIVIGGLYAFFNLVIAGYQFMSAGGDSKQIEKAFAKIWQSLIGLLVMAGSIILAAIFGWLLFQDPGFILKPEIYGP